MTNPLPAGARVLAEKTALIVGAAPVVKFKAAIETVNNNATLQNDNDLFWTVDADEDYALDLSVYYNSGTTPDLKFDWTYPAGTTFTWGGLFYSTTGTLTAGGGFSQAVQGQVGGLAGAVSMSLHYLIRVGGTPGTLQLQWAQLTANVSDTSLLAGSYGILTRVAS